jgi:hypothetical protein
LSSDGAKQVDFVLTVNYRQVALSPNSSGVVNLLLSNLSFQRSTSCSKSPKPVMQVILTNPSMTEIAVGTLLQRIISIKPPTHFADLKLWFLTHSISSSR